MTLSDISIKNPVFAWMLMAALMIFGFIGYFRMGVSALPDVDFPVASIILSWRGAAPEVMETDIVDPVEDSLMGIQGIRNVSSNILQGSASITIEFELNKDIDVAVQEIQQKLALAQRLLPREMDPPIINKVNPEDQPILWLSVYGDAPLREMMGYVQDYLKDQFTTVEGVGEVFLGGYVDKNLRVWVDDEKLIKNQITVNDVVNSIQQQHIELPAGRIETPVIQKNVRMMGEAPNPDDFGNIVIGKRAGVPVYKPIYLKQVATIEKGLDDIRRVSRTNGKTSVGLGIRKQRGSNQVAVSLKVLKKYEALKKNMPKGMALGIVFNQTSFIRDSIRELTITLLLSALATSIVCWIFLGSFTATVNILLAIPTSILGTFLIIYFLGFTLNTFTVLGLSLAVGIVVDDAIMVLENIVRYREQGIEKVEAARTGARQITFAAFAATLALIAIFLPVAFMTGIVGKFFFQYGITISVAVALSLLEALTLTPMRSSQFLRVGERTTWFGKMVDSSFKLTAKKYKNLLGWALDRRGKVIVITTILFLASLYFFKTLRKEFVPPQDQSLLLLRFQTPPDSSIDYTSLRAKAIEAYCLKKPEVDHFFSIIGGFSGGDVNSGIVFVTLKTPGKRPVSPEHKHRLSQKELMAVFRKELNTDPKLRVIVQDLSLAGFTAQRGFPVEFAVEGPDWDILTDTSEKLRRELSKSSLMTDVDTNFLPKVTEIHVYPDRKKAAQRGVDVQTLGQTIDYLVGGEPIAKYTESGRRYDVRIRLVPSSRLKTNDINRLQLWNNRGELVNLKDIVNLVEEPASLTITRRNRERAVSIFANVAPGKSQTAALKEVTRLAKQILPPGYHIEFTGSAQTFKESFSSLAFVLLMGILISYMVLASQFNSYLHPVIVLLALPFSISGALLALWIGNQSLNIYSFIGIILLMGIVKKNSILLVDFTNQYRAQGMPVRQALIEACPVRLRPILMTSIATITAAIPPALALGPGAEIRVPMAIAVIGGVIFSTLLTLLVVPSAYSLSNKDK
ncbi:MAG: efflux RND transporter permease subunit [Elusimicrobia bacterium]|nr:efflux RND transporter permease subunit [Candidatus Liberimonas magnetica]